MLATCLMKGNVRQQELGGVVGFFNSVSPMYRKTIDAYQKPQSGLFLFNTAEGEVEGEKILGRFHRWD